MPTEVGHDVSKLGGADKAVSVLIEDLEGLFDLFFAIGVLHLPGHHRQELGEVDGAVSVGIDLVDHVLKFSLCGVLTQRAHDGAKLPCGDRAVSICHHTVRYRLRRREVVSDLYRTRRKPP